MYQSKALTLAVRRQHPLQGFSQAAHELLHPVFEFMYGTPERTRFTLAFSLLLLGVATVLNVPATSVCPV